MGLLDNILGSNANPGSNPAVPGGNLTKPIVMALLALFASRAMGLSKDKATVAPPAGPLPTPATPNTTPDAQSASASDLSLGGILGGLTGMLNGFQKGGQGNIIDSWIGTGANKSISPTQLSDALGSDTLGQLARQTGLTEQELTTQLSQALPQVVDKLSPDGRLPTEHELSKLLAA